MEIIGINHAEKCTTREEWENMLQNNPSLRKSITQLRDAISSLPAGSTVGLETFQPRNEFGLFRELEEHAKANGHKVIRLTSPATYLSVRRMNTVFDEFKERARNSSGGRETMAMIWRRMVPKRKRWERSLRIKGLGSMSLRTFLAKRELRLADLTGEMMRITNEAQPNLSAVGAGHAAQLYSFAKVPVNFIGNVAGGLRSYGDAMAALLGPERYRDLNSRILRSHARIAASLER